MKLNILLAAVAILLTVSSQVEASFGTGPNLYDDDISAVTTDTIPLKDRDANFLLNGGSNPFDLKDPSEITQEVEYDPGSNTYIITEKIGEDFYRAPTYMTFEEYMKYRDEQQQRNFFNELSGVSTGTSSGLVDPIADIDVKKTLIDRLFGGNEVTIKPQGSIDLTVGAKFNRTDNPNIPIQARSQGNFDFDMAIQMNVTGNIGKKLNLATNFNTQATFGFENQMKLDYNTDNFSEDEIIKKIEAGDVSLPLKGTLIQGAQKLFGLKTELQFAKLRLGLVAAQQRTQQQQIQIQGGAQLQEFEVKADEYDENRHFFLTQYNRETFEEGLSALPQIKSLFRVKNIEVWVTNTRNETEDIVDIVALADIGEPTRLTGPTPVPSPARHLDAFGNALPGFRDLADTIYKREQFANDLLFDIKGRSAIRDIDKTVSILQGEYGLQPGKDFQKVSARKLRPNEFTFHPELGFVSLNVNLQPDDVLGVAFEYSYNGENYQVGEMSQDVYNPEELGVLFVKMLKSSVTRVDFPIWDLMMKNVYSLGAFQVSKEDFLFDIYYEDPGQGYKRFLPETNLAGVPLLRVFNMDRLNVQGDPCPDGIFDFVPGVTINPRNGRVMFPVLEPFGEDLVKNMDPEFRSSYEYFHLYDSTLTRAREYPELNRFALRGSYKSSISSEISLGSFNLPRGSVRVSAGGVQLVEDQDYEVDYGIGKVRIINDAILNSGTPINVSFEDNQLFGLQRKSMIGLRADYEVNKHLQVGGTYLHLFERPFTQKVNIGDDPISNRIFGLDVNYSDEAPWLTKMVDAIPLIQTKEPSTITFAAEAAYLKPGHSKVINLDSDVEGEDEDAKTIKNKGGTVYIDDFEGSSTGFDLRTPANQWVLASVPQNDLADNNPLFPESALINDTRGGANRAQMSWYRGDRQATGGQGSDSDPFTSPVQITEIFPNRPVGPGVGGATLNQIFPLEINYFPTERGPYNYDLPGEGTEYSAGLTQDGRLKEPDTRWAGIMRALPNNDFEAANIEYIDFWMLNPFTSNVEASGDLYFNLGNVSEDILRDSRRTFENGIPAGSNSNTKTDTTNLGIIPRVQAFTDAFDLDPANRAQQDVGLDGFNDQGEQEHFSEILNQYQAGLTATAYNEAFADPSNDNFVFFNNQSLANATVIEKYKRNNLPEGNSKVDNNSQFGRSATNIPDGEDLNNDNSLNEVEQYFQYHVKLEPVMVDGRRELDINNDYITDRRVSEGNDRIWYRFKIPIESYETAVGGIQDFRSIQFMRMYMKNFTQEAKLRFATLELTRNQWRRYRRPLETVIGAPGPGTSPGDFFFDLNAVSIEENADKFPFKYILPPGISREDLLNSGLPDQFQNEQSLSLTVNDLPVDSAVGVYKISNIDMRLYEEIEMFVHAEERLNDPFPVEDGDLAMIVRIGSDFQNNYYEYEFPLSISDDDGLSRISEDKIYAEEVWLEENNLNISLKQLIEIKKARNRENFPLDKFYEAPDTRSQFPDRVFRLKGNPNLGLVKGIMVAIINRDNEDFRNHSAEIWINELRLNGLDERGGGAALARLGFKLADFGNVDLAWNGMTRGYGGIEQNVLERSRETTNQFDIVADFALDKFLGAETTWKLPLTMLYSNVTATPEYDPYDFDIPLKEKLAEANSTAARDSIRKQAQDIATIKSINLTNVRKSRSGTKKKPMPFDISNFSATVGYIETERSNPIIESDKTQNYKGVLNYNYQIKPLYIEPFKKIIKKDKYFKLFSDANLNLIPNSFSFSTNLDREFQETKYRFTDLSPQFSTFYNKRFTWDRNYTLNWDITKALRFNFTATNQAIIDELKEFDGFERRPDAELKQEIRENVLNGGRTKNYNHSLGANYTLPFKKIPFLDFVTVKASYAGTYNWAGSAIGVGDEPGLNETIGNVIQNTQNRQINGDLNFETLYKKSKYLSAIDRGFKKKRGKSRGSSLSKNNGQSGRGGDDDKNENGGKKSKKSKRGANDSKVDKSSKDSNLNPAGEASGIGKNGKSGAGKNGKIAGKDKNGKGSAKGKGSTKKKSNRDPSAFEKIAVRPLLILRKARFNYTETFGTVLPGYMNTTQYLGTNDRFTAPGLDFVAGFQPDINPDNQQDWLFRASEKGWISSDLFQNQRISQTYTQNYDAKITLEPFRDFKVDLEATKRFEENDLLLFKQFENVDGTTFFDHKDFQNVGSFQISFFSLNTLFGQDSKTLFQNFESNRAIISQRLGEGQHDSPVQKEFSDGFGRAHNSVLVPAFLSAYTGKDANSIEVDEDFTKPLFKTLPKVNWKLSYNGLSKVGKLKEIFQSVKLSHGYKNNLTINSFISDQAYNVDKPEAKNDKFDYYSRFQLPNMVIDEEFNPLVGLSVKTKGGMDFSLDFKKARNLSMSFVNSVLSEQITQEYVFGFGYTMEDVYIPIFYGKKGKRSRSKKSGSRKNSSSKKNASSTAGKNSGKAAPKGNDLNFKMDFSLRDDKTENFYLDQDQSEITRGVTTLSISPSVDYDVSERLNLRLYCDHRSTTPANSIGFPTGNTNAGVVIRFTLQ